MRKIVKASCLAMSGTIVLLSILTGFYYVRLPDKFYVTSGGGLHVRSLFTITASAAESYEAADAIPASSSLDGENGSIELKLFGVIPIKEVQVEKIDRPVLIPCGTPFGIKITTSGAMVTGFGEVTGAEGVCCPATEAGIEAGDIIKSVNGRPITKNGDISSAVQLDEEATRIVLEREGEELEINLTPVKSKADDLLRIGLWVRDSSAGIGTVTYYDAENQVFGGLGHGVCDVDTGQLLPLSKGEAVSVSINNVIKGCPGSPGELCGTFLSRVAIGQIYSNTESGVFGTMTYAPVLDGGLPMAFKQEVEIGPATILSTISGNTPKEYEILIEKVNYNENNLVKNMVIRITDPELLSRAGGIVQGMSGSPIIQNGMLAGAVTHVFVNDTTRGYAIFAENMYRTSSVLRSLHGEPMVPHVPLLRARTASAGAALRDVA